MRAGQRDQLKVDAGLPRMLFIYGVLMLILQSSMFTGVAQENDPVPACTPAQRLELSTSIIENNLAFAELFHPMDTSTTAQDLSALVADYERFRTTYYAEVFPFVPPCSDAYLLRELAGIAYDQTQITTLLLTLLTYETDFGQADRAIAYADALGPRFDVARNSRTLVTDVLDVTFSANVNFVVDSFRACDAEQLSWQENFNAIRRDYEDRLEGLHQFLSGGETMPLDQILALVELSAEINQVDAPLCEPLLTQGFEDAHLYTNTTITLLLNQLLDLERTYGDGNQAKTLNELLEEGIAKLQKTLQLNYPALFVEQQTNPDG